MENDITLIQKNIKERDGVYWLMFSDGRGNRFRASLGTFDKRIAIERRDEMVKFATKDNWKNRPKYTSKYDANNDDPNAVRDRLDEFLNK